MTDLYVAAHAYQDKASPYSDPALVLGCLEQLGDAIGGVRVDMASPWHLVNVYGRWAVDNRKKLILCTEAERGEAQQAEALAEIMSAVGPARIAALEGTNEYDRSTSKVTLAQATDWQGVVRQWARTYGVTLLRPSCARLADEAKVAALPGSPNVHRYSTNAIPKNAWVTECGAKTLAGLRTNVGAAFIQKALIVAMYELVERGEGFGLFGSDGVWRLK